jgi:hypothetical protein
VQQNHRRVAVIGGGVGIATAGAIAFIVISGHPDEEPAPRELPRQAPVAAPIPKVAPGQAEQGAARPIPAPPVATKDEPKQPDKPDPRRTAGVLGSTALKQGGAFASLTGTGDISSGFDDVNIYGGLLGNEAGEMQGGFGYGKSGFGPGGGGTGWGTIGTGRYGSGGMRGRSSAVPTVSIGQPKVGPAVANADGNLDKAIIRRYVKRNIQKIQYCYEKELVAKTKLAGTVSTSFTILDSGKVSGASASGVDAQVASCVAGVLGGIEFPKPRGTGGVSVSYPFTFRPAGS